MAGVSVDTGPSEEDLDFRRVAEGGSNFIARMEAMSAMKSANTAALAKLKVGNDIVAALDDAQRKQAEAKAALDDANATLANAQQEAKATIQKAKEQAADIVRMAQNTALESERRANGVLADADEHADSTRKEANAALVRAKDTEASAESTKQAAVAALKEQQDAKAAHLQAKAEHEAEKAKYLKLRDSIAEFVKGLPL